MEVERMALRATTPSHVERVHDCSTALHKEPTPMSMQLRHAWKKNPRLRTKIPGPLLSTDSALSQQPLRSLGLSMPFLPKDEAFPDSVGKRKKPSKKALKVLNPQKALKSPGKALKSPEKPPFPPRCAAAAGRPPAASRPRRSRSLDLGS